MTTDEKNTYLQKIIEEIVPIDKRERLIQTGYSLIFTAKIIQPTRMVGYNKTITVEIDLCGTLLEIKNQLKDAVALDNYE